MEYSYEGIGQVVATFPCSGVREGMMISINYDGVAVPAKSGERLTGQALSVSRDGSACSVLLSGLAKVPYDDVMSCGWQTLSANASTGGVSEDVDGREYLVVAVDEAAMTAIIKL